MKKSFKKYSLCIFLHITTILSAIAFASVLFKKVVGAGLWQIDWTHHPTRIGHNAMRVFTTDGGDVVVLGLSYMTGCLLVLLNLLLMAWVCSLSLEWFNCWRYNRRKNQMIAAGQWMEDPVDYSIGNRG